MNQYLSKLLAFLSQVPNGNVTDTDLFVVIHRALKEATDAGLIDSDDLTTARLHQSSKDKEYAIVSQSLIDALVKENSDLKWKLAKANDPRNASNQSQPKRRKAKAKPSVAEQMIAPAPVEDLGTTLPDGTYIACVVGK